VLAVGSSDPILTIESEIIESGYTISNCQTEDWPFQNKYSIDIRISLLYILLILIFKVIAQIVHLNLLRSMISKNEPVNLAFDK
jgi:hypothetical protein